ncbi:hypothetical protein GWR56_12990 [Mucilaginibacter sp. 14171R-50]|uniref:hypothetical protein n=1 Tax=Mucilaginibacter sp. 14171R-50 TaxID=2703789 RepID=UPI00138B6993|nr:hypothetical protein [Mucilaginibacter sp. 14171R-50]QHS56409.1 hypothetical protein GWR56_12990 [Mucilaginibacter sp. 14171R-50]
MAKQSENKSEEKSEQLKTCGIIMPISPTDGYTDSHWQEVMAIIKLVVTESGFEPNIVSNADDVGIIHNRIVNNLAENPIVICDVSSKNPNVMFELGLRLAFDKATIIIKDDITSYNFDTSPIEHLGYPADLHYHKIEEFKVKLKGKLLKTYEASKAENYSTFLKHFVNYKPKLTTEEVPANVFFEKQFEKVFERLDQIERKDRPVRYTSKSPETKQEATAIAQQIFADYLDVNASNKSFQLKSFDEKLKLLILQLYQKQNGVTKILPATEIIHLANQMLEWKNLS